MKKKVLCIILARTGSKRLKKKVLKKFGKNEPTVFDFFLKRIKHSNQIDKIVLATTSNFDDKILIRKAQKKGVETFSGSQNNVLDRVFNVLKFFEDYQYLVRANVDCPFFMPSILDETIKKFKSSQKDIYSPFYKNSYPFGFSFCVFKLKTIFKIKKKAKQKKYKEHIENFCFDNKSMFKIFEPKIKRFNKPNIRITLDTEKDFQKMKKIYKYLKKTPVKFQPQKLIKYFESL